MGNHPHPPLVVKHADLAVVLLDYPLFPDVVTFVVVVRSGDAAYRAPVVSFCGTSSATRGLVIALKLGTFLFHLVSLGSRAEWTEQNVPNLGFGRAMHLSFRLARRSSREALWGVVSRARECSLWHVQSSGLAYSLSRESWRTFSSTADLAVGRPSAMTKKRKG